MNKAISDFSFANSKLIFTTFGILVNNDTVDHSGEKVCYNMYENITISPSHQMMSCWWCPAIMINIAN